MKAKSNPMRNLWLYAKALTLSTFLLLFSCKPGGGTITDDPTKDECSKPHFNTTYHGENTPSLSGAFNVSEESLSADENNCRVDTIFYHVHYDLTGLSAVQMDGIYNEIVKPLANKFQKINGGQCVIRCNSIYTDTLDKWAKLGYFVVYNNLFTR